MSPIVRKTPRALDDLIEHFQNIVRDKAEPAYRFLGVAEQSFKLLASNPGLGTLLESEQPRLRGIRQYPMPGGFRNFLIFYRPMNGGVEVLTVLHGARDIARTIERMSDIV